MKLVLRVDEQLQAELEEYERYMKHEIYKIAGVFKKRKAVFEFRYKYISNQISWHSKGIVLEQAKKYYQNEGKRKHAKLDFSSIWSEYSYQIDFQGVLALELGREQGARKLSVPFYVHEQQIQRLQAGKRKDLTIKHRGENWFAFIVLEMPEKKSKGNVIMGIDVGIKVPAVAYLSDGHVKFFGSGREIRYYQRRYRKKIQIMQRQHQWKKLRNFEHKLHHILQNFDHQISKEIIDYACDHEVGMIKMERLTNINKQFNVSYSKDIYLWSYRRIQTFIEYKARLAGIKVQYIQPYNTSKRCPICGKLNQPKDRLYVCSCGFHSHRDLVGARNIQLAL